MCSPRMILGFFLCLLSVSMVAADKGTCLKEYINGIQLSKKACAFADQSGNHYTALYGTNCQSFTQPACCMPAQKLDAQHCTIIKEF
ncbi:hypothetical protein PGTUg99_037768 [Puccinia graminis f. sp. tritici]|uniref:Uncharacterized protein n=1 Tax=Puccinia graminis f. sp. tritici TaxID=56615 RepID=A0A5B0RA82_PUCGR|nr:hypothetical protein PGTUg99_037768 [Puccinia graminis f. sp. tritici]